jgi:signal transduction histidine kinase
MALASIVLGWWMAGRVLSPLRRMTATARQISAENLHQRLALDGPHDELKELGDTVDGLLGRLEGSFEAQRRFVANASHELRTPLTLQRAMIEVAIADASANAESLRAVCERVLVAGEQQERLIEALLTLARSERGLDHRGVVDLEREVRDALAATLPAPGRSGPRVELELAPAALAGDGRLIGRLAANLIDNAIRHNVPGGWIRVVTATTPKGEAMLSVTNSGPVIAPAEVDSLLEPFRRASPARIHRAGAGQGLGLSIALAITAAHEASLELASRPTGGLEVTATFPAVAQTTDATERQVALAV